MLSICMYVCTSSAPDDGARYNSVRENPGKAGITRSKSLYDTDSGMRGKNPAHALISLSLYAMKLVRVSISLGTHVAVLHLYARMQITYNIY